MANYNSIHKYTIYSVFILSGFAGLIYETVWSQYLGLFLGHAAYAQTLTLAIFMGGMAIGSFLISKYISRIKNAILWYAGIELILGIMGLFFHDIFKTTMDFSFNYLLTSMNSPLLISVTKWLIASLLILPQSILLGSTFPLISAGLIRRIGSTEGAIISTLYFSNSIGASFGAIVTTFFLIPGIGMPGSIMIAALLNFLVAILIYVPAKSKEPNYIYQSNKKTSTKNISLEGFSTNIFLVVAALTGFASFVYEITWIRMLNLVFGSTLHSFEIMLSSFILGLALGGLWIKRRIDKIENIVKYLGVIQVVMGLMAILTMPLYMETFSWLSQILLSVLQKTELSYTFYNIVTAVFSMLIMLPAAFCAGMTLPLLSTTLLRKGEGEKAIGKVYSSNTIGGLLGVWFAIHIGMVYLGLKNMLLFASAIDALLGMYLIKASKQSSQPHTKQNGYLLAYTSSIVYIVIFGIILYLVSFSPRILSSGTYRTAKANINEKTKITFYKDGKSASISVTETNLHIPNQGGTNNIENIPKYLVISTNGKPDAGIKINLPKGEQPSADEPTMVLAGAIPLLMKPNATEIANIGFGSGLTTHVLLSTTNLKELDTIEIEPVMVEGAKFFYSRNYRAYDDIRSNIIIDDAKTFFASSQKKYDIIVSEPSNPWVIGVGNLFSKEFYKTIKRYLENDGLLVQWLQLYEISPEIVSTALNALSSEFNYYEAYMSNGADLIIIASQSKIPNFKNKNLQDYDINLVAELEKININKIESILSRKLGDKTSLAKYFSSFSKAINSDFFPIITLNAPKDRFMQKGSRIFFYTKFDIPVFELLRTQKEVNNLLQDGDNDSFNIFTQPNNLYPLAESMINNSTSTKLPLNQIGMISIFNHPEKYCHINKLATTWLSAYAQLYDTSSLLGFETLEKIINANSIIKCLEITNNKQVEEYIHANKLFAKREYSDYINYMLNTMEIEKYNNKFKRSLINKALFSDIKLEGKILNTDLQKLKKLNAKTPVNKTTRWLLSYIHNL